MKNNNFCSKKDLIKELRYLYIQLWREKKETKKAQLEVVIKNLLNVIKETTDNDDLNIESCYETINFINNNQLFIDMQKQFFENFKCIENKLDDKKMLPYNVGPNTIIKMANTFFKTLEEPYKSIFLENHKKCKVKFDEDLDGGKAFYFRNTKYNYILCGFDNTFFKFLCYVHEFTHIVELEINKNVENNGESFFGESFEMYIELLAIEFLDKMGTKNNNHINYLNQFINLRMDSIQKILYYASLVEILNKTVDESIFEEKIRSYDVNLSYIKLQMRFAISFLTAFNIYNIHVKNPKVVNQIFLEYLNLEKLDNEEIFDFFAIHSVFVDLNKEVVRVKK